MFVVKEKEKYQSKTNTCYADRYADHGYETSLDNTSEEK